MPPDTREIDAFDLPEWLGVQAVTWTASTGVHDGPLLSGELSAGPECLGCDLLAADAAYPLPVLAEEWRRQVHRAWTYGQVLLVEYDGRLTLATPGTGFTADRVLEALGRLAKAVAASPARFTATLRL